MTDSLPFVRLRQGQTFQTGGSPCERFEANPFWPDLCRTCYRSSATHDDPASPSTPSTPKAKAFCCGDFVSSRFDRRLCRRCGYPLKVHRFSPAAASGQTSPTGGDLSSFDLMLPDESFGNANSFPVVEREQRLRRRACDAEARENLRQIIEEPPPAVRPRLASSARRRSELAEANKAAQSSVAHPSSDVFRSRAGPSQLPRHPDRPPLRTCEICFEEAPLVRHAGCSHPPLHCEVCLTAHITICIREGSHNVTCPAVGCTQAIDVHLIQRLVAKADFELFSDALTRKLLSQDQDVVFCSNATCATHITVTDGGTNPVVTCPLCRSKTCFLCQSAWHSGLSCAEAKLQRRPRPGDAEAERLTQEYLRVETRHCPKCGTGPCMKTSADECDVATCPRCLPRFRFCWSCGADYDLIFKTDCKSHRPTCRYYS